MDILFVASELSPTAKTAGPSDVVTQLSKALRLLGHKVTICLPRLPAIEQSGILVARRLTPLVLRDVDGAPGGKVEVTIFDGRLNSGVELLLLEFPGLVNTTRPAESAGLDEPRAAALFSRAVVEVIRQRAEASLPFEVVHVHDWAGAMVPYLLRRAPEPLLAKMPAVLSIHDLSNQRLFPRTVLRPLGLTDDHFTPEKVEFYGHASFLKAGVIAANALTTVSPTYAAEMLTPEGGERYEGLLRTRESRLTGIVNGIDYAVYNPMTDPAIIARYDADDSGNKGRCKSAVVRELGLDVSLDRPLLFFAGPMTTSAGADLLASTLPKILRSDAAIVMVGRGDADSTAKISAAIEKHQDRAALITSANDALVHRLYAGADFVVVPARREPCGFAQLIGQRYGAIPIARRTGGLADTIVDCDEALETGTGFLFDKFNAQSLLAAVQRALAAAVSPRFHALRRRVMRLDLGWDRPARRYVQVYRAAVADAIAPST
ncbi:MAG: glycogen synthase [Polyangiaceae bacterium]|nr:glycogen synthase [Polyangiaceae bacterium]